jgi:hypothetical protein
MVIKKKKDTFNDYSVEMSWGQLNAAYRALEKAHADPLADEMFAELGWYLQNVPGPGEDEDEYKAAKDAEKQSMETGQAGEEPDNGELVGQEVQSPEGEVSTGEEVPGSEGPVGPDVAEEPPMHGEREEPTEADTLLDRPPAMA